MSMIQAEPPEDSAVVWQYCVIKAEQAVARKEYLEAERLYQEAWRSLPKEDRDGLRMHRILGPLILLYETQQRDAEATILIWQINEALSQESRMSLETRVQTGKMLDKYLTAEWLNAGLETLSPLRWVLRKCDPIIDALRTHDRRYENNGEHERAAGLKALCADMDSWASTIRSICHVVKAREHALKAFLIETEGIKAERDAEAAEIAMAREKAQEELQYYGGTFRHWTCQLTTIAWYLPHLLKRDLPGLSHTDRAKLEQYEEIAKCLTQNEEKEWERFPIEELLDIAAAYLPGTQGQEEATTEAETKN
jgi:hypothetical protein